MDWVNNLLLLHPSKQGAVFVHVFTCVTEVIELQENSSLLKNMASIQQCDAAQPANQHLVDDRELSLMQWDSLPWPELQIFHIFQSFSKAGITQEIPLFYLWSSLGEPFFHLNISTAVSGGWLIATSHFRCQVNWEESPNSSRIVLYVFVSKQHLSEKAVCWIPSSIPSNLNLETEVQEGLKINMWT